MADGTPTINLKILSPNFEGDISLSDLAVSTTVQELRAHIQDAMASRPATERMRLIYRGRVVMNETDTLTDVFGAENIRNFKEQSLHLVLRELPGQTISSAPSPSPRSSTAPPNPFRPIPPTPPGNPLQTNPFRTLPQPRPNSQPQLPHQHHHHHHLHHHHHPQQVQNPFAHIPIPPELQAHIAQSTNQNPHPLPQNAQDSSASHQPSRHGTPAPADGGQAPLPEAAPALGHGPINLPPHTTRTIRHETLGPNGERWTMTINDTNVTIPAHPHQQPFIPRAFPQPPGFAPPRLPGPPGHRDLDQVLNLARAGLQAVRQDMENARALFQPPGGPPLPAGQMASTTPPPWRIERIRHHVQSVTQNLERVQRGLTVLLASPAMAQNRDVLSLQGSANALREQAETLNGMVHRLRDTIASSQASTNENSSLGPVPTVSSNTNPQTPASQNAFQQGANQPSLADVGSELFILSSPQGPVGILFDQRGIYSTAPMGPTMPFQSFTQQFSSNRQLLTGIGQQIFYNSAQLQNQLAAARSAQMGQGAQPQPEQPQTQNQGHDQNQNQNQAQNQAQNPVQIPAENDRLVVIAGHLWLVFKLACFIYIFAGHGGWYRPAMMGVIAAVIYLAQVGIFDEQFNAIRGHFEALLPLADRAANRPTQNANVAPGEPRVEPNRNLTPGEAAQRLLRQHHENRFGWIRDSMRTAERAFALFVASLWPGIGERMVEAQEERVRAEARATTEAEAEAESRRLEEVRQRDQEQEQEQQIRKGASSKETQTEAGPSKETSSGKGKERVEVAEEESSS